MPSSSKQAQVFSVQRATSERGDALPERSSEVRLGLAALDERISQGQPGLLVVHVTCPDAARSVERHVLRHTQSKPATPRLTITARSRAGAPLWQDVLLQLEPAIVSVPSSALQPTQLGMGSRFGLSAARREASDTRGEEASVDRLIAAALTRTRGEEPVVFVVAPLPAAGSWDESVALELTAASREANAEGRASEFASPFVLVFLSEGRPHEASLPGEHFEIAEHLDDAERESWWSVIAAAATQQVRGVSLPDLEAWWTRARRAGSSDVGLDPSARPLVEKEVELLTALALACRPWRRADVTSLGADFATVDALVRDGIVREHGGWLTLEPHVEEVATRLGHTPNSTSPAFLAQLAATLVARAPSDPWAHARAAELYLKAQDFAGADAAMDRALASVEDAVARSEMSRRWAEVVGACLVEGRIFLQCRAAERALAIGEAEEAHRWARAAAAATPEDTAVTLLLGRSLVALGDLVAAEVTLKRGQRGLAALDADQQGALAGLSALLAVELAEVAYLKGDMAGAGAGAQEALNLAAATRAQAPAQQALAKARNTLGKILLAEAKWDEADRHFAEDALIAASAGDTTSELRARLNRGIAFLSNGALDDARVLFEEVRCEGERTGDYRASAFALDNLAVVATWRHEYGDALALSERTLKLRQRLGDRLTTARIVGNLAELRRKLGLLVHAEHAIAFGRRALGPGMPPERSAHFSFVAARVALERGQTDVALHEITRALRDAELAGHRPILAEAHRVAARIALEDGDIQRARAALAVARELMATDEARADVAMLEALLARAVGDEAEELGLKALDLARKVGEEEGLLEAHLLLGETYRGRGDLQAARSHLMQAIALREQVGVGLPSDVLQAFLARRDVLQIIRLEAQLAADGLKSAEDPCALEGMGAQALVLPTRRLSSSPARTETRELVGADPLMRGLQATIRKVARSNSTVLIRGESGTGKELVAAALHRASDRAAGPMVTVNCAALVETLLLSELFGHEKGAFTGAIARRRGRFELAEGGTLFLDEIGDISPKTQVALLRVLQERTFERVGGTTSIRADVHIICATHRDLRAMVERGEFREDLYYRLRGITLEVPALRARLGDLPSLSEHLLDRIAAERGEPKKTMSSAALDLLALHRWPGNVRELENALRAASLFAETGVIGVEHLTENVDDLRATAQRAEVGSRSFLPTAPASGLLPGPASLRSVPPSSSGRASDESRTDLAGDDAADEPSDAEGPLPSGEANATAVAYAQVRQGALSLSDLKRQIERDCIARALAETRGNITKAASLLGMKRPRLSQLVKQYGLAAVLSEAP